MSRPIRYVGVILGLIFLVACGDTGAPTNPFPSEQPVSPTDPNTPSAPTGPVDASKCTYVLNENITVPSRLENTAAGCDYLLEGYVNISSMLVIDPGVVVVASQDAILWVDGGQIQAVGTPEQRIVMQGLNPIQGYWDGIRFAEGRESQFEYFDLKDAGQTCSGLFCSEGAMILDDVTVSLANSTISNSYVRGLNAAGDIKFTKFENNRFYNNVNEGILVNGEYVSLLDVGSDYSGGAEPNGTPYVRLALGDLETGAERVWKKLNAPYLISGYLNIEGGVVTLEPGVDMVFGDDARLKMEGNGELRALGTAAAPILFRGLKAEPGYWDGITFWDSDWDTNEFNYVEIRHSGFTDGLVDAYAGIRLRYQSTVKISNTLFADNAEYAIACDEQSSAVGSPKLILGSGNTFSNNASGDIDPECQNAMP